MIKRILFVGSVSTLLSFLVLDASASAQSTPYFQGKTIMLIQGREPGGTGALRVQAAIPFFKKYLPGESIIVTQFMPGGRRQKGDQLYLSKRQARRPDRRQCGLGSRRQRDTRNDRRRV